MHEGGSGSFTVTLNSAPTDDVTIAVSSDNAAVTVAPMSLTFTADGLRRAADGHGDGLPRTMTPSTTAAT